QFLNAETSALKKERNKQSSQKQSERAHALTGPARPVNVNHLVPEVMWLHSVEYYNKERIT
ncbi:MAG: hypothetical protein KDK34_07005, partial [Leptospiraceae bacterium]|nr:hypothetical protein [Leptospiraceae bacterium]